MFDGAKYLQSNYGFYNLTPAFLLAVFQAFLKYLSDTSIALANTFLLLLRVVSDEGAF